MAANYNGSLMAGTRNFPPRTFTARKSSHGPEECFRYEINSSCTGKVIGRGGSKIKEIQEQCQVFVRVDKSTSDQGVAVVEIKGDAKGIELAKRMIDDTVTNRDEGQREQRRMPEGGHRNFQKSDRRDRGFQSHQFSGNSPSMQFRNTETKQFPEDDFTPIDWKSINQAQEEKRNEMLKALPPLIKKFYEVHPEVASMTTEQIDAFRKENNNIMVQRTFAKENAQKDDIPNPVIKFEHCFSKYPDIMEEIRKQGFQNPSPIQCQGWPVLMSGEDLIGIAQTGSGKTLAFLLPAMIHTEFQPIPRGQRGGPNVLILAPTRELALQIRDEVAKYHFRGMKSVCIYGGGSVKEQIETVDKGVEIVIATPGRLNDLVARGTIDVSSITYLVLDEADRMLDMGFEPQIRKVLLDIRPDRQTVMTSATWPPGVRRLAQSYMNNPIQVYVGTLDLAAVHTVTQIVEIVDETDKWERILQFVQNMAPNDKAIIFCGRKARADELASELSMSDFNCQCIHGDRDQVDRERAVKDIKSGYVKILIATDVASRGLDIEDITHVVNYDFPKNMEEYVHRVGRTGRAGRSGIALSLITRKDWGSAAELIRILEEASQEIPEELRNMADRFSAMKERRDNERAATGGDRPFRGRRNY
ncbi:probable ATP-dependent RNA helicase DDX43 [Phlebotomus papatasi]|uniref:probable ATP-dependent RNA helicase DDX43 n=1 Tax=Phlebotomus papatasi TaxID=29031 RepID=UPI0024837685|nr:probable ATP-dependent RNA helicase DDX43 [Phlebotomus papatasi]